MNGLVGTSIDIPGPRTRIVGRFFERSDSESDKTEEEFLDDPSQDQDSILDSESGEGEKTDSGEECESEWSECDQILSANLDDLFDELQ